MLFVVNKYDSILARFDAWDPHCMEKAAAYAKENGLEIVRSEVTFSGNMVLWVE